MTLTLSFGVALSAIDCGLAEPLDLAIAKFRNVFADSGFSGEGSSVNVVDRFLDRSPFTNSAQQILLICSNG